MRTTNEAAIRRQFELSSLRHASNYLKTGEQWHEYNHIRTTIDMERVRLNRQYRENYATKVEQARQKRLHEAASRSKDFRFAGHDRFDKEALTRQAQRDVRQAYERDSARIDDKEIRLTQALYRRCGLRNSWREKVKTQFDRAIQPKHKLRRV